jgi:acetyltransferase-like isoleucine patch superfamily enzyme
MTGFSKHLLKECGCDVRIAPSVVITHPDLVCIGDHVAIDDFVYVSTGLSIGKYSHIGPHSSIIGGPATGAVIEDFCSLAAGVRLVCGTDDFLGSGLPNPTIPEPYRCRKDLRGVVIHKHAILGTCTVVLTGIAIGEGAAVGARSLVTRDLDPWSLYVGTPARKRGPRERETILAYAARLIA